ncbi:hypothetical protein [Oceanobacter sp. 3_MG-2023]|uniref:hypothetical protein n=1 Tax=Oceanobacter sp. 3_MG-2023 TaxID=3062622 RepID=UPI0027357AC0|nr:hypothetical protein [Oceanobacter sp. 3_MG-2023]MDP2505403.1 hypothetical protein [Oceanobacter sp. 3_MG-2023]
MSSDLFCMGLGVATYFSTCLVIGWLSYRATGWILVSLFGRWHRLKIVTDDGEEIVMVRAKSLTLAIEKLATKYRKEGR